MAKRSDYLVRSTYNGEVTGQLDLTRHTRGEANTFARKHSRAWPSRIVHILSGDFPLASFSKGREIKLRATEATGKTAVQP